DAGIDHESLSTRDAAARYPQISFDGVSWCIHETGAGYLLARRACERVLAAYLAEGGEYRQLHAVPGDVEHGELTGLRLSDGSILQGDQYIFACGPWLAQLFPQLRSLILPTRQDVFFFGTPANDSRFTEESMPIWLDKSVPIFYGIPGNEYRGLKVACDTRGSVFDPTSGDRLPSNEAAKAARDYLELRFPALKGAPVVEARVCQYENTPDQYLIIDRLPHAQNTVIVGGGSGHGFKHGPAVGERVTRMVLDNESLDRQFSLERFTAAR
ncbi:MAG TPA: FAD-dependent oxidoreductase, partial [Blastocatellia bacterium]|nr:FAD-dependent oxidoreductase [Blastocatellia bacterium]